MSSGMKSDMNPDSPADISASDQPARPDADSQALADEATALRRAVLRLGRRLQAERGYSGLSPLKLSVLGSLYRYGVMTPGQLASLERYQPQSLTRVLGALEHDGLITRRPNAADGRQALLELTPLGAGALTEEMLIRDNWLAATIATELNQLERGVVALATEIVERLADAGVQAPATNRGVGE